jgi:hypothetical protein
VEASEAMRRIFWRHRWLLVVLMIVPVLAVVPYFEHKPVTFSASANVQGQGTTPDATTQVSAIQSRVTAVATDPATVQQAISAAHVNRDATRVARHDVSVKPLSASAVMVLTVTDKSRTVAVSLARSLAATVVSDLNNLGTANNPQLNSLYKSGQQLTSKRDKLSAELSAAEAQGQNSSGLKVQDLLQQLNAVEQQLSSNQSAVQQILATANLSAGAQVLSLPTSATGTSRHVAEYGALAALLGLVIGMLIGTIREVVRPTVAQPGAGARDLGTVVLGSVEMAGDAVAACDDDLAARVDLAAQRLGADTIVLTGPVSRDQLRALAAHLSAALPGPAARGWLTSPASRFGGHVPVNGGSLPHSGGNGSYASGGDMPALAVVLTPFAPHGALDQVTDLAATTEWPVLGVISLRRRRGSRTRRRALPDTSAPAAATADNDALSGDTVQMGVTR